MKQGEDTDLYITEETLARSELEKMGKTISDRRFKNICAQGFMADYKNIKIMMYRNPTFDIDQVQISLRCANYSWMAFRTTVTPRSLVVA